MFFKFWALIWPHIESPMQRNLNSMHKILKKLYKTTFYVYEMYVKHKWIFIYAWVSCPRYFTMYILIFQHLEQTSPVSSFCSYLSFFKTGSHIPCWPRMPYIIEDGLGLLVLLSSLLTAGITGMCHHTCFMWFWGIKPRTSCMLSSIEPAKRPQSWSQLFLIGEILPVMISTNSEWTTRHVSRGWAWCCTHASPALGMQSQGTVS